MKRSTNHINVTVNSAPAETSFFQDGPRLGNQYDEDSFFQSLLDRLITNPDTLSKSKKELHALGHRVTYELIPLAKELDQTENQPRLVQHEAWGRRTDVIVTHPNWKHMHGVAAVEGLVSDGYNVDSWGRDARLIQFAKLYLFAPSSGLYSCPLAMTDGAIRYLQLLLKHPNVSQFDLDTLCASTYVMDRNLPEQDAELHSLLNKLVSRDPQSFITSGQWMTERAGGSDVGLGTETIARRQSDGSFQLFGYKWFTSGKCLCVLLDVVFTQF